MDAEVATQIYLVYIGKATKNLNSRLGGRIDSYLAHKEGNPHSDSKTMMCPAEKCAIEDGELIAVSYATIPVGSYPKDWEAELIHQYVLQHGIKPGYKSKKGNWCRGNYQQPYRSSYPPEGDLTWSTFSEYSTLLKTQIPPEPGVYRITISLSRTADS